MDPISAAIITALSMAAKDVLPTAAKDAYNGLKSLLTRKFGGDSDVVDAVKEVENEPEAEEYQELLQEEVKAAGLQQDEEIIKAVQALIEQMKDAPGMPEGGISVQQTVTGDKNIVAGTGNVTLGDVDFGA